MRPMDNVYQHHEEQVSPLDCPEKCPAMIASLTTLGGAMLTLEDLVKNLIPGDAKVALFFPLEWPTRMRHSL